MVGSFPLGTPEPFFEKGEIANVLLIHGYTGTPYDFRYLSDIFLEKGLGCYVPLLTGHGTQALEINTSTAAQWLNDAEQAFHKMPADKPRIIAGLSMGGLIATILAAKHAQEISGLMLLAPAFQLTFGNRVGIMLARLGLYHFIPAIKKSDGPCDVADPVAKRNSPAYLSIPLKGLIQLNSLQKQAIRCATKINCPVFAAFGKLDHTVDSLASIEILKKFGYDHLQIKEYMRSQHVLPIDIDKAELADDLAQFCQDLCIQSKAGDERGRS